MAQNPQTAVAVVDQSPDAIVEWNLDNWPVEQFNRLVPTQVLGLATDLIRPIVQVVQLDIEKDTYTSTDLAAGCRAPNARGLALLAGAAGIDFPDEVRVDDGSNPNRAVAKVWATMFDATGRQRTIVGSRDYDVSKLSMTDAQRKRAKGHLFENALTRARHRAMRVMLGLAQQYTIAELQKPFAVVSYVPNMQHPEVRSRMLDAMAPVAGALFGGSAKQLGAGAAVIELPDEDDPRNVTPPPASPTTLPGEKLAAATAATEDEPDEAMPSWAGTTTSSPATVASTEPDLFTLIRDSAGAGGMQGPVTEKQIETLQAIFEVVGGRATKAGLVAIWKDIDVEDLALEANQAQALINAAHRKGKTAAAVKDFADEWRAAVDGGAAA